MHCIWIAIFGHNLVKINPEKAEELYNKARSDAQRRFNNLLARAK